MYIIDLHPASSTYMQTVLSSEIHPLFISNSTYHIQSQTFESHFWVILQLTCHLHTYSEWCLNCEDCSLTLQHCGQESVLIFEALLTYLIGILHPNQEYFTNKAGDGVGGTNAGPRVHIYTGCRHMLIEKNIHNS